VKGVVPTRRDSQSKSFDRTAKVRTRRESLALRSAPGQELSPILRTTSRGYSTHSRCPKPRDRDNTFAEVGCQKAVRAAGFRSCQDLCLRLQATYELAVRPGHCDCAADKSCVLTVLCRKAAPMVPPNSTTPEPAVLAKQAVLYTLIT
jgi:hypothetical protein